MRSLRSAQAGKVVAGLALMLGMRLIAAFRMKLLTDKQGLTLSLTELFEISATATLYGLVLPGVVSGGLIRWYQLARRGEPVRALASLTMDRLADATMVAVIGVVAWLVSPPAGAHRIVGPMLLAVCGGLLVMYLAGFSRSIGNVLLRPVETVALPLRLRRVRTRLAELAAAARRYQGGSAGFAQAVAALALASQLAGAAAFFLFARSLGTSIGFAELAWARSSYMLLLLLPITFAGLGAREGILILLLQPYGMSGADAVALSFLQLGGILVIAALGGLFELRNLWRVHDPAKPRGAAAPFGDDP